MRAPAGGFIINADGEISVVLVAGGIGASEAFAQRIAALKNTIAGLSVIRCWTRAIDHGPDAKLGHAEFSDLFPPDIAPTSPVYLCGPPAMTAALRRQLASAGHPRDRVFEEMFAKPRVDEAQPPEGPFEVTFARSGKKATWTRHCGSLLELADAAGISMDSGCRAGQCETCRTTIVRGRVKHIGETGSSEPGSCLACLTIPLSDLVIDA